LNEKHAIKTACTNDLPDDEHMVIETYRRHQEEIIEIGLKLLKNVHLLVYVT
jgi:16S rRNA C967 or C1407 C5-methylase (RsmB/RsmF family)